MGYLLAAFGVLFITVLGMNSVFALATKLSDGVSKITEVVVGALAVTLFLTVGLVGVTVITGCLIMAARHS